MFRHSLWSYDQDWQMSAFERREGNGGLAKPKVEEQPCPRSVAEEIPGQLLVGVEFQGTTTVFQAAFTASSCSERSARMARARLLYRPSSLKLSINSWGVL